jgi:hypothetical protein
MKSAAARKKPATTVNDVEAAAAVLQSLEQRLIQAKATVDGFGPARDQHSYAAAIGDPDAQSALNLLAAEQAAAEHLITDLTAAL